MIRADLLEVYRMTFPKLRRKEKEVDIDFKVEVDHHWIYERPYKVTLTRGAKGDYRWEIEVRGVTPSETILAAQDIDRELYLKYAVLEPTEEEG